MFLQCGSTSSSRKQVNSQMSTVKNLLFVSSTGILSFVSIEKRRHIVNAFHGTCLFLFPLKKWKKFLLSWCSQRVRKRPFALNGLLGEKFLRIMFNNGRYKIVFKISILYLWYFYQSSYSKVKFIQSSLRHMRKYPSRQLNVQS